MLVMKWQEYLIVFMKANEMALKAVKKDFFLCFLIVSPSSCLAQLFRTIQSLTILPKGKSNDREFGYWLGGICKPFCRQSLITLPATFDTIMDLKAFTASQTQSASFL